MVNGACQAAARNRVKAPQRPANAKRSKKPAFMCEYSVWYRGLQQSGSLGDLCGWGKFQFVVMAFEVEVLAGEAGLSDETTEVGYFSLSQLDEMDIFPHHKQFILDALAGQDAAFIR